MEELPSDRRRDVRRPVRGGVDGDDVWPSLSATELEAIASVDRAIMQRELTGPRAEVAQRSIDRFGGVPIYSFAERVRHFRDLVDEIEKCVANDDALLTELHCRSIVERLLDEIPDELRSRLRTELLDPLDERFRAATVDDGGRYLRDRHLGQIGADGWWWRSRRPGYFSGE